MSFLFYLYYNILIIECELEELFNMKFNLVIIMILLYNISYFFLFMFLFVGSFIVFNIDIGFEVLMLILY